jgi:hypothetical protein
MASRVRRRSRAAKSKGKGKRADRDLVERTVSPSWGAQLVPSERPVCGQDLRVARRFLGWDQNLTDAAFGIPRRTAWYKITSKHQNEPVEDFAHAVLLRLYLEIPASRLLQDSDPFEFLKKAQIELTELALMTGRRPAAAHHWEKTGALPPPVIQVVQALMRAGVNHRSHPDFERLMTMINAEYAARGDAMPEPLPRRRHAGRTRDLVRAEKSMLIPVED